jgi:putative phosphoribosyl transferase
LSTSLLLNGHFGSQSTSGRSRTRRKTPFPSPDHRKPSDSETIDEVIATELAESRRLDQVYCGDAPHVELRDKAVILVDDGIATASALRTAAGVLRLRHPARIVIAVPVANSSSVLELRGAVNDVVACKTPDEFDGVGQWYEDFRPIAEESVRDLCERAKRRSSQIGKLKPESGT